MKAELTLISASQTTRLTVQTGQTLKEALRQANLAFPCGGRGVCGKCRVQARGALTPPDPRERALLGAAIEEGTRLACMARMEGDCVVTLAREGKFHIAGGRAGLRPQAPLYKKLGAAVDIGTTTIAVQLYGPEGLLGEETARNDQSAFGADVISRIGAALEGKGPALQKAVSGQIEGMLGRLAKAQGAALGDIDAMVLTGNTTMLYLISGKDPEALSHAPFEADCLFGETVEGETLGFSFSARCYLPRCMHAFVGADIATALLASGMADLPDTALLADVGTNGELALWHKGELTCCSTAAGPAFEGAQIECGSHGVTGAVDAVWPEGEGLGVSVIDGGAPTGICGSGIVDAVAALVFQERIGPSGRMDEPDMTVQSGPAARIAGDVYLSQRDIRNVQLAKSAVCAGVRTLLEEAGLEPGDISAFYIAGGFGSFLNIKSAAAIGLFPPELAQRAKVVGNAALHGAALLLLDGTLVQKAEALAGAARHIDLTTSAAFMDYYVEGMMFGEE